MVGVNNSGKSSLSNFFYEFRHLFKMLSYPNGNLINAISGYQQDFSRASSILDNEEVFCNTNKRDLEIQFKFIDAENDPLIPKRIDIIVPRGKFSWLTKIILNDGQLNTEKGISFSDTILLSEGTPRVELSHFFKICKDFAEIHYIGPFRNAINIGSNQDYYDIQVGQAFIREWRNLKTGNIKKYNEAAYKLTEDIKHIFGFTDLEINPSDDDQTLQVFINGKSYKLSELGSGITQFIVVLVNAVKKQPSYIFIDEPELNLHPSLQLDFLTTLGSYSKEGVLFATHSIGLARASADWIYSVNKINHE